MDKFKPTKEQLEGWIEEGLSFSQIEDKCGYSKASINRFCKEYKIERPKPGRKKGYRVSPETRQRMMEAQRRE